MISNSFFPEDNKFELLFGVNYQIEFNCSEDDAQAFEEKMLELVGFLAAVTSFDRDDQDISELNVSVNEYIKKLEFFISNTRKNQDTLSKNACLNNNLSVFNSVLYLKLNSLRPEKFKSPEHDIDFLDYLDLDVIEKSTDLESFKEKAKLQIETAMQKVEKELVQVEYRDISESVINNMLIIQKID